jgi:bacterioferritin (cytochrome b1)
MKKEDEKRQKLLETLRRSLTIEYSLIVHYPRLANSIRDEKLRDLVTGLGTASIKHANVIADTITRMGGKPVWSFDNYPGGDNLVDVFKRQLEKEKLALQLHQESANLVDDITSFNHFKQLAEDEKKHIVTVNEILSSLQQQTSQE